MLRSEVVPVVELVDVGACLRRHPGRAPARVVPAAPEMAGLPDAQRRSPMQVECQFAVPAAEVHHLLMYQRVPGLLGYLMKARTPVAGG